jgi:hypothetical protein
VKAGTPLNRQSTAKVATISLMASPVLLITTGSHAPPRLAPGDIVPSEEGVNPSDLTRRVAIVVDNANNLLLDLHREIPEIGRPGALRGEQPVSGDAAGDRRLVTSRIACRVGHDALINLQQTFERSHLASEVRDDGLEPSTLSTARTARSISELNVIGAPQPRRGRFPNEASVSLDRGRRCCTALEEADTRTNWWPCSSPIQVIDILDRGCASVPSR